MKVTDYLSGAEIKAFSQRTDWYGFFNLLTNWGIISVAFGLSALWPNPVTILLSILLLSGRQLAIAVAMHDASHKALFKSEAINEFVGKWFCAYPVFASLEGYRTYHLRHHAKAGTLEDPDLSMYKNYPVSPASFRRKILRDLSGITGVKAVIGALMMYAGVFEYQTNATLIKKTQNQKNLKQRVFEFIQNLYGPICSHFILFGSLLFLGHAWVYLLWWISYLTLFQLFLRLRIIGEHAVVPNYLDKDPRQHTRTTYANWWVRLTLAPCHVNYHLEHHILPGIPPNQLPNLHQRLLERGAYGDTPIAKNYLEVIQHAIISSTDGQAPYAA